VEVKGQNSVYYQVPLLNKHLKKVRVLTDGNNNKYIDLHLHSTFSDGTFAIKDIVEHASTKKLSAISLTDHDCIAGISEITELARRVGLEVVPGVEISSMYEDCDVHILGYYFDINNPMLIQKLDEIRQIRYERAKRIVDRLNSRNIALRFERVLEFARGFSIGRPHIAAALMAEEYAPSYSAAFDKFLGKSTEFYIPVQKLTPKDAIRLIKDAGGLAVLAHPYVIKRDDLIASFARDGLDGIEVYCPKQPYRTYKHYRQFCHQYNLVETGGSDCHGPYYEEIGIGSLRVPEHLLDKMKKRLERRNAEQ